MSPHCSQDDFPNSELTIWQPIPILGVWTVMWAICGTCTIDTVSLATTERTLCFISKFLCTLQYSVLNSTFLLLNSIGPQTKIKATSCHKPEQNWNAICYGKNTVY
jgi:hypothetical protein